MKLRYILIGALLACLLGAFSSAGEGQEKPGEIAAHVEPGPHSTAPYAVFAQMPGEPPSESEGNFLSNLWASIRDNLAAIATTFFLLLGEIMARRYPSEKPKKWLEWLFDILDMVFPPDKNKTGGTH